MSDENDFFERENLVKPADIDWDQALLSIYRHIALAISEKDYESILDYADELLDAIVFSKTGQPEDFTITDNDLLFRDEDIQETTNVISDETVTKNKSQYKTIYVGLDPTLVSRNQTPKLSEKKVNHLKLVVNNE